MPSDVLGNLEGERLAETLSSRGDRLQPTLWNLSPKPSSQEPFLSSTQLSLS